VSGVSVIRGDGSPRGWHEFVGADHGDVGVSLIFVDTAPGRGPRLHRHDYDELFVVLEGEARILGGDDVVVRGGDVVVIPAGEPHGFVASGEGRYRQISVHLSPRFATEWLDPG
jgi:mannose-6-phosphate isomerase-like protein (cupin superfamily)